MALRIDRSGRRGALDGGSQPYTLLDEPTPVASPQDVARLIVVVFPSGASPDAVAAEVGDGHALAPDRADWQIQAFDLEEARP